MRAGGGLPLPMLPARTVTQAGGFPAGCARHHGDVSGRPQITDAMIARRAFEISLVDASSTPEENWERAERELREEAALAARREGDDQS